jgi:Ser/Thr protein kinase RdoA (MazF antagonist)
MMEVFESLSAQGQARRLRHLALFALEHYGLVGVSVRLLQYAENTTYRIDQPHTRQRFLLRVHGEGYQTAATIRSECLWLKALQHEAKLVVPDPVLTPDGQFCLSIHIPGVPTPRLCSLLRWIPGRRYYRQLQPHHLTQLGRLAARLHRQARHWRLPPGFVRRRWDWQGLFGPHGGFGVPAGEAWRQIPEPYYTPFRRVTEQLGEVMQALGDGPEVFGLIHSDLGRSNTVFAGGEACAIDFDDCGFGYWLYDIATTLRRWRWTPQWPVLRDAFWAGYTLVHALPAEYTAHLDTFIAGRSVSIALWAAGRAKAHAGVRHDLHRWFETAACFIAQYERRQAR